MTIIPILDHRAFRDEDYRYWIIPLKSSNLDRKIFTVQIQLLNMWFPQTRMWEALYPLSKRRIDGRGNEYADADTDMVVESLCSKDA